jgi:hypothetical protein
MYMRLDYVYIISDVLLNVIAFIFYYNLID